MQTCLYDGEAVNFKQLITGGCSDQDMKQVILKLINNRAADGFEAERRSRKNIFGSMAAIGG